MDLVLLVGGLRVVLAVFACDLGFDSLLVDFFLSFPVTFRLAWVESFGAVLVVFFEALAGPFFFAFFAVNWLVFLLTGVSTCLQISSRSSSGEAVLSV